MRHDVLNRTHSPRQISNMNKAICPQSPACFLTSRTVRPGNLEGTLNGYWDALLKFSLLGQCSRLTSASLTRHCSQLQGTASLQAPGWLSRLSVRLGFSSGRDLMVLEMEQRGGGLGFSDFSSVSPPLAFALSLSHGSSV